MTNEEAKVFLDNLKICINEHPIVADWLVEIADRKTDNGSEKPNNCENCKHHFGKDYYDIECEAKAFGNECKFEPKDEPQTDRSMAVGKRSDATADKYHLYGKTTTDEPQTERSNNADHIE